MQSEKENANLSNTDDLLKRVKEYINPNIDKVENECRYIFDKFINESPYSYFNKGVYQETYEKLELLVSCSDVLIDEKILYNVFVGYQAYLSLTNNMKDIEKFNIDEESKTRMFRINIYTSLVESCYANFFRAISLLLEKTLGKDYSKQTKIHSLIEVMRANGFSKATKYIDVNIRNAISHGRVISVGFNHNEIHFGYMKKQVEEYKVLRTYEFDSLIKNLFDTLSAVLLAVVTLINNYKDKIHVDLMAKDYIALSWLELSSSQENVRCLKIYSLRDTEQLDVELQFENHGIEEIIRYTLDAALYLHKIYSDYKKYMISFRDEKMQWGFFIYDKKDLDLCSRGARSKNSTLNFTMSKQEHLVWWENRDDINHSKEKYLFYDDIRESGLYIKDIEDISIDEYKRFSAKLYIKDVEDKAEILRLAIRAINRLKCMENWLASVKHGKMEADLIYLPIYRFDLRNGNGVNSQNENLVCLLIYQLDGVPKIKHGGIFERDWNRFCHEKIGRMDIAWRERKYGKSFGRNQLCFCGSNKKFKKCCGKN